MPSGLPCRPCHPPAASYNEYAFEGLDFLLNEASQAGIKLIMVPLNLWKTSGVPKFEQWCGR